MTVYLLKVVSGQYRPVIARPGAWKALGCVDDKSGGYVFTPMYSTARHTTLLAKDVT